MYGKIHASLFHGSMLGERNAQHVFMYLIAHSDRDGHVDAHPKEIATLTGIPEPEVAAALAMLQEPDPNSRSREQEGRRIERIDESWTWFIVNREKYANLKDSNEVREGNRVRKRASRARHAASRDVTRGHAMSHQAETEVETEESRTLVRRASNVGEPEGFAEWYGEYPRHVARRAAARAFGSALKRGASQAVLLAGLRAYRDSLNGTPPDKIKHPATWLNGDCWLDEASGPAPAGPTQTELIRQRIRELDEQEAASGAGDA